MKDLFDRLTTLNVLCVGDVILDQFVEGSVSRVSPEAPIPILNYRSDSFSLGGIGNVAQNLKAWGCNVTLLSVLGNDQSAQHLEDLCHQQNISPIFVKEASRRTSLKTRFVANGQHLLRVDHEVIRAIAEDSITLLLNQVDACLGTADLVIISDYAKGVIEERFSKEMIAKCRAKRIPVFVDPNKNRDYGKFEGATLIKPNLKEFKEVLEHKNLKYSEELISDNTSQIMKDYQTEAFVVTMGQKGLRLFTKGESYHVQAVQKDVFDVSGAGDTVLAALAAFYLAYGHDFKKAAEMANLIASIAVSKVGTSIVYLEEIERAYDSASENHYKDKMYKLNSLMDVVHLNKRKGKKIGFTNGCFDLLHLGHLSSLKQAKSHCDFLIVGLNSDESIKRLKGQDRPIQSQHVRQSILAELGVVDAVIIFDEDTPLTLIKTIQPHYLFKGKDYQVSQVVGGDFILANGGEVVLLDLEENYSTTNTIKKMRNLGVGEGLPLPDQTLENNILTL